MMNIRTVVVGYCFILLLLCPELSAAGLDSLLPKELPENWALVEGPRTFNRKTLFEHINGQADLFLKYGFERSLFAGYQNSKKREEQIDLDLYDMGNVLQAFGIFSRHRSENQPGGLGLDSFVDDQSVFFYQDRYFVVLNAVGADPSVLKQLALAVSSRIGPSSPPRESGFFPSQGLKAGSIQYFPEGLLGHQFLKRGFRGTYFDGAKEFHLFVSMHKSAKESGTALKAYRDYLSQKGKVGLSSSAGSGQPSIEGEDPYKGRVICIQRDSYLLGAVGFETPMAGRSRLEDLVRNLK
jgi:hypothetical protein